MISTVFPIFYEAVVEQTYPIAEGMNIVILYIMMIAFNKLGTSAGILTLSLNIGTLIFSVSRCII